MTHTTKCSSNKHNNYKLCILNILCWQGCQKLCILNVLPYQSYQKLSTQTAPSTGVLQTLAGTLQTLQTKVFPSMSQSSAKSTRSRRPCGNSSAGQFFERVTLHTQSRIHCDTRKLPCVSPCHAYSPRRSLRWTRAVTFHEATTSQSGFFGTQWHQSKETRHWRLSLAGTMAKLYFFFFCLFPLSSFGGAVLPLDFLLFFFCFELSFL